MNIRCPHCNKYTRSVHDKLKPIAIKYLDVAGYTTYLKVYKRRFNCNNCGKRFTEDNFINGAVILLDTLFDNLNTINISIFNIII